MTLHETIKTCRIKAGMTQDQVASKLGCSKQYISGIENGLHRISIKRATEICAACGYTLSVTYETAPAS